MIPGEIFEGELDWGEFARACEAAEAELDHRLALAAKERDTVLNALSHWPSVERVKAAAEARYQEKAQQAQEICDKMCETALMRLMELLDSREKEQRLRQVGLRPW